jgi:transcriptional repressor NrdR
MVIKKDGRRERFDREKIVSGLKRACQKRPISTDRLEAVVIEIEKKMQEMGETEIISHVIGQEIMDQLQKIDHVAYVRFASVYKEFKDVSQFTSEINALTPEHKKNEFSSPA